MSFNLSIRYSDGNEKFSEANIFVVYPSVIAICNLTVFAISCALDQDGHPIVYEEDRKLNKISPVVTAMRRGSFIQDVVFKINDKTMMDAFQMIEGMGIREALKAVISVAGIGIRGSISYVNRYKSLASNVRARAEYYRESIEFHLTEALRPIKSLDCEVSLSALHNREPFVKFDANFFEELTFEEKSPDSAIIDAYINQYNARTGSGRLSLEPKGVNFGFSTRNASIGVDNLVRLVDGLRSVTSKREVQKIRLLVSPVYRKDKTTKYYLIESVVE